jgi:hypothetical protein
MYHEFVRSFPSLDVCIRGVLGFDVAAVTPVMDAAGVPRSRLLEILGLRMLEHVAPWVVGRRYWCEDSYSDDGRR